LSAICYFCVGHQPKTKVYWRRSAARCAAARQSWCKPFSRFAVLRGYRAYPMHPRNAQRESTLSICGPGGTYGGRAWRHRGSGRRLGLVVIGRLIPGFGSIIGQAAMCLLPAERVQNGRTGLSLPRARRWAPLNTQPSHICLVSHPTLDGGTFGMPTIVRLIPNIESSTKAAMLFGLVGLVGAEMRLRSKPIRR
jgi:hypothetical protein